MFSRERFNARYEFSNLGALCPKCYRFDHIGDIDLGVHVKYHHQAPIHQIRFHSASGLNMSPENLGRRCLVNVYCLNCGTRMIMVDDEIVELLHEFNRRGLYTKYSCYGHVEQDKHSQIPYISFYHMNYFIHWFNQWMVHEGYVEAHQSPKDPSRYTLGFGDRSKEVLKLLDSHYLALKPVSFSSIDDELYLDENAYIGRITIADVQNFWKGLEQWLILFDNLKTAFFSDEKFQEETQPCKTIIKWYQNYYEAGYTLLQIIKLMDGTEEEDPEKGETDVERDEN